MLKLLKQPGAPMARRHADDLVFYAALGIILGGRIGYVLFYNLSYYLQNPIDILKLWDGGMSFHGGMIGTVLGILYLSRKEKLQWLRVHDYVACTVPIGLFFGRLANFVNHELWGAPAKSNVPWAVRFPEFAQGVAVLGPPRHPSQLYEAILEGLVLFVILWAMFWKTQARYEPGKLVGRLHLLLRPVPLPRRVRPRTRRATGRLRAVHRPAHGSVAVAPDDHPRRLADVRPPRAAGSASSRSQERRAWPDTVGAGASGANRG